MDRTVGDFVDVAELLDSLINNPIHAPTTLIVCSTKRTFLYQLIDSLPLNPIGQHQAGPRQEDSEELGASSNTQPAIPDLLSPTLGRLAASRSVRLAFCPTTSHLRAFLAVLPAYATQTSVIILNLMSLHHGTSEFSVQGLSRSLSLAVSAAAARSATQLRLAECADVHDPSNPAMGFRVWDSQVPLLSGSVRLSGEGGNWAGRSISVRRVVARWFIFEERKRREEEHEVEKPRDDSGMEEEMLV